VIWRRPLTRRPLSHDRGRLAAGASVVLLAAALGACGGLSTPSPQSVLAAYLQAWSARQWSAMGQLVTVPPPDFVALNTAAFKDLGVTTATFTSAPMLVNASTSSAVVTEHLQLGTLGTWSPTTKVTLSKVDRHWLVSWTPQTINPALPTGSHFAVTRTWAARASILGAGGATLAAPEGIVNVGIEGSRVKDAAKVTAVLVASGATAAQVSTALSVAAVHPSFFEQVFQITEARYQQLGGVQSPLYQVPGTVFQHSVARAAVTPGLASHLVGAVGPITAQELSQLGSDYDSSQVVGQSGIEQAYQRQLAGTPGGDVIVVSPSGVTTATLMTFLPQAGTPVRTSIDVNVQRAAEAAMATVGGNAAMVAVRVSTGQVLASVSNPLGDSFDQAFNGRFPPGSTFKVIDSTALFNAGLTPASPASCTPSITVNGQVFHNAEGDGKASTVLQAFTESCNTAFIGLVDNHLSATTLQATAAAYGLGTTPKMGLDATAASVPVSPGSNGLAAAAIGQGEVLVSPLNLAMVAVAVGSGTVRQPRLVVGAPDDTAPTHQIKLSVVGDLRQMMAAVVTSGTAANTGLPAGTHAKTGTAEYGTGTPQPTDAWLMGYDGDIAFAIVVQGTGNGGPTDGPIIAKFLTALGVAA
jgi:cell division protein FtsI/penicillin-binding protein 2